jgi:hypothetical protein
VSAIIRSVRHIIPDPDVLVRRVAAFSTSSISSIHGEQHWQIVAAFGLILARETPCAGPLRQPCRPSEAAVITDAERMTERMP